MERSGQSTQTMIDHGSKGNNVVRETTVAAVVVTYNRKELLARCLDAIFAQSRPVDRIIVVDNCSTDGTPEFLRERGFLQSDRIEYVRLSENGGSAGGFHEGMKRAYKQRYDWLWLMDDDGAPAEDALAALLQCPVRILYRGCVVLNRDSITGEDLAFAEDCRSGLARTVEEMKRFGNSEGIVEGFANPSNGVLVSSEVISRVGAVDERFFIWGEDIEYRYRVRKAGLAIATVLAAKFYHPPDRGLTRWVRVGVIKFGLRYAENPGLFYLIVRNHAYITFRHRGPVSRTFLKVFAYPVLFPRRAALAFSALWDGVFGRFCSPAKVRALITQQSENRPSQGVRSHARPLRPAGPRK